MDLFILGHGLVYPACYFSIMGSLYLLKCSCLFELFLFMYILWSFVGHLDRYDKIPATIESKLFPFQREGVRYVLVI